MVVSLSATILTYAVAKLSTASRYAAIICFNSFFLTANSLLTALIEANTRSNPERSSFNLRRSTHRSKVETPFQKLLLLAAERWPRVLLHAPSAALPPRSLCASETPACRIPLTRAISQSPPTLGGHPGLGNEPHPDPAGKSEEREDVGRESPRVLGKPTPEPAAKGGQSGAEGEVVGKSTPKPTTEGGRGKVEEGGNAGKGQVGEVLGGKDYPMDGIPWVINAREKGSQAEREGAGGDLSGQQADPPPLRPERAACMDWEEEDPSGLPRSIDWERGRGLHR